MAFTPDVQKKVEENLPKMKEQLKKLDKVIDDKQAAGLDVTGDRKKYNELKKQVKKIEEHSKE